MTILPWDEFEDRGLGRNPAELDRLPGYHRSQEMLRVRRELGDFRPGDEDGEEI